MKRSGPIERKTALTSSTPLPRSGLGRNAGPKLPAKPKRRKETGPSAAVRRLVAARSGGMCEWPGCFLPATDDHHRLNRKAGGRHGEMRERINQAAWILDACRTHHAAVTSAHGEALIRARALGWLLREGEDARHVPVVSRHGRVFLLNDGGISLTAPPIFPTTA